MSQIWLPRTLTEQPDFAAQVDWRNQITAGLKFLNFPLAGGIVSAVNPALFQYQTAYGKSIVNNVGLAIQQLSPLYPAFQTGPTGITGANYSLFAVATAPGLGANIPQNAVDDDTGGGGIRKFQFRIYNGTVQMIVFDTSVNSYSASSAALGAAQTNGFSFGATVAGNNFAVWANGSKSPGAASNTQATPTGNFWIASNKAASTSYPGNWAVGGINTTAGWGRTLADWEMVALWVNPWQLFKAPPRRIWAVSGGGTNVAATIGASTLTGQAASVTLSTNISALLGATTLTGQAASVALSTNISALLGATTLTGQAASVALSTNISALLGATTFTGQAATIGASTTINATYGVATLTGQAASIALSTNINAATATTVLTGQAAAVALTTQVTASLGINTFNGQPATIAAALSINALTASTSLTGLPASIGQNVLVQATSGTTAITGLSATILSGLDITTTYGPVSFIGLSARVVTVVPPTFFTSATMTSSPVYAGSTLSASPVYCRARMP